MVCSAMQQGRQEFSPTPDETAQMLRNYYGERLEVVRGTGWGWSDEKLMQCSLASVSALWL
jgi:hypothetical protein